VRPPQKNGVEWAVFAVSLLLVGGLLVYLVAESFTGSGDPPRLVAAAGRPELRADRLVVPVSVTNNGDAPVENVLVAVTLPGAEPVELTIPRLAHHERAEAEVSFEPTADDPGQPTARVLGYTTP